MCKSLVQVLKILLLLTQTLAQATLNVLQVSSPFKKLYSKILANGGGVEVSDYLLCILKEITLERKMRFLYTFLT